MLKSNEFIRLVSVERMKLRGTAAWWLTLAGGALLPALYLTGFLTHSRRLAALTGNPWLLLFDKEWQMLSFLLPLYIVLVTSFVVQVEHRAGGWQLLLSLPIHRSTVYFSKLFLIIGIVLGCYGIFILLSLGTGTITQLVYPHLSFFRYTPPWETTLDRAGRSFFSTLGLLALQYWISLRFKNFVLPLGIGIAGTISGMIVIHHWKGQDFYWYAQPALSLMESSHATHFLLGKSEWLSLGYFLILTLGGCIDFMRRRAC